MGESFDPQTKAEFDKFAGTYDDLHAKNVALSGESPEYFAIYKQKFLERLFERNTRVLDFGCGIGNLTRLLVRSFDAVVGYDPSGESVALAKKRAPEATFYDDLEAIPEATFDAVVLANVLHHVPPENRPGLMTSVSRVVAPGGKVVVFEHNPINPVTRKVVRECEFDENAVLLYPSETRRLLKAAHMTGVTLDYIVFFPRALSALRSMESVLSWLPMGAQYAAWGTKQK
jgi:ubiquinone/menaquinone biosynthesis C-methylase UbiE